MSELLCSEGTPSTGLKRKGSRRYCAVYKCSNCTGDRCRQAGITFHTFPRSQPERTRRWEQAMHRQDFTATKWAIVCSEHFLPDCFNRDGYVVRLKKDAMPTIKLPADIQEQTTTPKPPKSHLPETSETCLASNDEKSTANSNTIQDAIPTVFKLPAHVQEQTTTPKPPKSHLPETSETCLASNGEKSTGNSNTIQGIFDHDYTLPSPWKLKRPNTATDSLRDSLRKRLKVCQQKSRRLKKKVQSMENVIGELKNRQLSSEQAAKQALSASFSGAAFYLVKRCIDEKSTGSCEYPPELRTFAQTLQFYSSRAYEYVRDTFNKCLPHPQTLNNWYKCIDQNPGLHDEVFDALQEKQVTVLPEECCVTNDG